MRTMTILKLSTGIALGMAAVTAAAAQQADTGAEQADVVPQDSAAEAAPVAGLQDIVVTAQRRSENLQRAALAITAVSSESLVRAGVSDTQQLTRVAPSLQISTLGGSAAQFYLRGVGNFTTNSLSDAAVSVNLDGVAIVRSSAVQGMFYDLERVEVLKGPQGTLYGRNATGGAINIITAKPRHGELSGYVTAEYGNFDALKLTSALNLPAGDDGAIRVAGFLSDRDGYYSDGTGDDKTRAIRVQFSSQLTDSFKLIVGSDYAHVGGKGAGATVQGLNRDERIGLADPRAGAIYASTFVPRAGAFLHPIDDDAYQDNSYFGIYAQADIDTSLGTLTLLPAFRHASLDFLSYAGSFAFPPKLKDDQITFEARLASDDANRLSYIVGLYYLKEDAHERAAFNQQFFAPYVDFESETKSYAGFLRLAYKVTDEFRLTAGARYTVDDKSASIDSYNALVLCLPPPAGGGYPCLGTPALPTVTPVPDFLVFPNGDPIPFQSYGPNGASVQTTRSTVSPSETFKKLTYRLGFEYDVGPQSLLYGSFETGFKSGGFFSSIDNPIYEPETIDAFTLGSKNRFFGNRLQLNLEAFWWTYKDQQVSHFVTNSQGGVEFVTENVGKTRIRGVEVEAVARVGDGTTLNGMVQYLDAKNLDFTYANPAFLGPPVTGCPNQLVGGNFVIDCGGRRPVNAPEWSLSGGIEQVFEVGYDSRFVFNADGRYQSSVFVGFEQLPEQKQKGYFMADLQLKFELDEPDIYIAGFVNNVTDKNVASFIQPHPQARSLLVEALRPPRTYGVRVGYKF